ncbi:MAG: hypothetical protein QOG45_1241 [Chloroflexota bacterium]|nr:hypothetical protein [Chloroflexota bacterium]
MPHELRGEEVWVREHGDEVVAVHVGTTGAAEVARHLRTTPGNPRIDDGHFPPQPAGPLSRTPTATSPAEAEFLAIGMGARRWLSEAGPAGVLRVRAKMARAVALAKFVGVDRVNWALGHAAVMQRFDEGDSTTRRTSAPGPLHRPSEATSLQTTKPCAPVPCLGHRPEDSSRRRGPGPLLCSARVKIRHSGAGAG